MPTSLQRHRESSAERRRIGLAVFVALLLHLPVFLSPGAWRFGTLSETPAPPLEVRIELQNGSEAKNEIPRNAPPAVERLAAPAPERSVMAEPGEAAMDGIDDRVAASEPLPEAPEVSAPDESAARLDAAFAQTADEISDELTRAASELANPSLPASDAVLATIAPSQERALTRRLVREAQLLLDSGAAEKYVTFENDNREFAAVLTRDPAANGTGIERITADITTEHGGQRARTSMQMKRLAFSHFTQLVDRWDPEVALHDDEIAGRFHSNSVINVSYDRKTMPRLLGKVSTARGIRIAENEDRRWRGHVPHRRIFAGGLETRAARITLPEISLPAPRQQAIENADVHVVRADTLIVFHADGGYDCVELESRAATRRQLARERLTYIMGVADTELHVRGVVDGNVTVYSPERIVIQGNLTYARGVRADGNAYLGLVSDGNVEIDRAEVTGPGDLAVHAAIYARKRFVVRNINARRAGTLFMYGSLTAGSLSATEPRYATRIEFDPRFERVRPPGFPETDRYEIENWDGRWEVTEAPVRKL